MDSQANSIQRDSLSKGVKEQKTGSLGTMLESGHHTTLSVLWSISLALVALTCEYCLSFAESTELVSTVVLCPQFSCLHQLQLLLVSDEGAYTFYLKQNESAKLTLFSI